MLDNLEIGQRLKVARKLKSLSQKEVGLALGVTSQQVQKYERGVNRISVDAMLRLDQKLGIKILEGVDTTHKASEQAQGASSLSHEELELIRAFRSIKNKRVHNSVLNFLKAAISG